MIKILWAIVCSFGKIGLISLGGGNSMLKLLQYEVVDYRHWLANEEFIELLGSTFLFPGLTAVKLAALIGYKAAGVLGLLLAVLFLNLPGLILAIIGYRFLFASHNPQINKIMLIVQYGALSLLTAATFSIAKEIIISYTSIPLALASMLFLFCLIYWEISPFLGFIVFIGIGFFLL